MWYTEQLETALLLQLVLTFSTRTEWILNLQLQQQQQWHYHAVLTDSNTHTHAVRYMCSSDASVTHLIQPLLLLFCCSSHSLSLHLQLRWIVSLLHICIHIIGWQRMQKILSMNVVWVSDSVNDSTVAVCVFCSISFGMQLIIHTSLSSSHSPSASLLSVRRCQNWSNW